VRWRSIPTVKPPKDKNIEGNWQYPANIAHPGSTIWIKGARHPLLDPGSVVPTDLLLDDDIFIVLITGPNTGGKTVSLKTTGLMVLMAQSGMHLPAIEAKVTVFADVFADIGDEQSIEQNLSTFSGHMTNITRILEQVDDRCLVLLDELGAGTDPAEGAALAQAIVSFLRDKGATTFVATHFPELKVYASQTPGATNASLLFDVETLMPTYERSIGMPGRSNAFAIARRLGVSESILDEALELVGASSSKAESLLDTIYEMREKITSQEAGTRFALKQARDERDRLRERLENIESERQEILEETKQQAELELEEVRREKLQIAMDLEPMVDEPKKPRRKPHDLRVGDTVLITPLGAKGQIVTLDKREAEVAVGRLHMRARLEELELKKREEVEEVEQSSSRVNVQSRLSFQFTLGTHHSRKRHRKATRGRPAIFAIE
jgi:DNA mismatch repair protein MutS2